MTESPESAHAGPLRVLIAGAGVAGLELALALGELAGERVQTAVIAPNAEFAYRPLAVREPFAYAPARRYPVERIVRDAGAELIVDELAWVDPAAHVVHTRGGQQLEYGALALALGARARPRYQHAITIDDARLDEVLHGLIQDIEQGFVHRLAFVIPARMAWPLPVYELALMTATRAYDMNIELQIAVVSPEDTPLAIFGGAASEAVAERLAEARVEAILSAYAEIPEAGKVAINPCERHLEADRVVALPELFGPGVRGIPAGEHGFIRTNPFGEVPVVGPVFAAGDGIDFPVKHGGLAAQQAEVAARSIAVLAGAPVERRAFTPLIRGMLLTGGRPLYMCARITGGRGFASQVADYPLWSPPTKVWAAYLSPYLDALDREAAASTNGEAGAATAPAPQRR